MRIKTLLALSLLTGLAWFPAAGAALTLAVFDFEAKDAADLSLIHI